MSRSQPGPPVGPAAHVSGLMLMTTHPINTWKSCDTQGFLTLHQHDSSLMEPPSPLPKALSGLPFPSLLAFSAWCALLLFGEVVFMSNWEETPV